MKAVLVLVAAMLTGCASEATFAGPADVAGSTGGAHSPYNALCSTLVTWIEPGLYAKLRPGDHEDASPPITVRDASLEQQYGALRLVEMSWLSADGITLTIMSDPESTEHEVKLVARQADDADEGELRERASAFLAELHIAENSSHAAIVERLIASRAPGSESTRVEPDGQRVTTRESFYATPLVDPVDAQSAWNIHEPSLEPKAETFDRLRLGATSGEDRWQFEFALFAREYSDPRTEVELVVNPRDYARATLPAGAQPVPILRELLQGVGQTEPILTQLHVEAEAVC